METKIIDMAVALYDGGWRASDADELKAEYDWDEESGELGKVVEVLQQLEEESSSK